MILEAFALLLLVQCPPRHAPVEGKGFLLLSLLNVSLYFYFSLSPVAFALQLVPLLYFASFPS